jgi:rfaE bifunctional protein kinase chain/domain
MTPNGDGTNTMNSSTGQSSIEDIVSDINSRCPEDASITFLNGDFNVVHPGHLRLLNFAAECGNFVVVGVNATGYGNVLVKDDLRLQSIQSNTIVDYAFLLAHPPEDFITLLKPATVVKGKEHENDINIEQRVVESYGGQLRFSSGDIRFSSMDLLHKELSDINFSTIVKPWDYPKRHNFSLNTLPRIIDKFSSLNVIVLGDVIIDEYVTCEPLGMSQEDPTIVVSPLSSDTFLGGAGIVAAHTQALGASTTFFSVTGSDAPSKFAKAKLEDYGVGFELFEDTTRPTPHKKRYRAHGKTLLRVSDLRHHEIHTDLCANILKKLKAIIDKTDLLIFSDFNYGFLPQSLVDSIIELCKEHDVFIAADSQASSQYSDISRFKGANFITPTEREARLACHDFSSGLAAIMHTLQSKMNKPDIILSMGSEGILIQTAPDSDGALSTDQLPSFNKMPSDVAGAGDSLIASASMCLALGAGIWQASYLGSIAAACQVGRIGNTPLTLQTLITELKL